MLAENHRGEVVTNHEKAPTGRGLPALRRAKTAGPGFRSANIYSAAVMRVVGGCSPAPLFDATTASRLLMARAIELRTLLPLFDSTKSEMRGTISERKREPLNTP